MGHQSSKEDKHREGARGKASRKNWQQIGVSIAQKRAVSRWNKRPGMTPLEIDEGMGLCRRLRFAEHDLGSFEPASPPVPPPPRQSTPSCEDVMEAAHQTGQTGSQSILASPGSKRHNEASTPSSKQKEGWMTLGFVADEEGTITHTWPGSKGLRAAKTNSGDITASSPQWSIGCYPPVSQICDASLRGISGHRSPSNHGRSEAAKCSSDKELGPLVVSQSSHCLLLPAPAWVPPTWRADEITVVSILGTGGQAVVYLAERSGFFFALKVALDEQSKLALERECLLNLMQDSPHLPNCYAQVVDAAGLPCGMALEYLDGGDLHHALARLDAPLSQRQMALLARDIARGLLHLHSNGVLHLDLKCLNVMLEGSIQGQWDAPRVVVVDLGMAVLMEAGLGFAWQHEWSGTLSYLDHLRLQDGPTPVTTASDIFSLGLVIYQMVSREPPFSGLDQETQLGLLKARMRHSHLHRPLGCSDYWWGLVQRCTALDPCHRPSLAQILVEMEGILAAV